MIAFTPSLRVPSRSRGIKLKGGDLAERWGTTAYLVLMLSTPLLFWSGVGAVVWLNL